MTDELNPFSEDWFDADWSIDQPDSDADTDEDWADAEIVIAESHRGAFGEFAGESSGLIDRTFRERILLVGVTMQGQPVERTNDLLDELERLVDTAGADVVARVQAEEAAAYPMSLAAGRPIAADRMATMADGIAVGLPGAVPFDIVRSLVDRVDTVSEAALSRAMLQLLEHNKLVVEPAGAAGVALLNEMPDRAWTGPIVVVLSGGNIDPLLMLRIIRHGMVAAGRYLQFRVVMPDRPGSLARLIADCAAADANVVEVEHLRHDVNLLIDEVDIFVQLETKGQQHCQDVLTSLRAKGYRLKFA